MFWIEACAGYSGVFRGHFVNWRSLSPKPSREYLCLSPRLDEDWRTTEHRTASCLVALYECLLTVCVSIGQWLKKNTFSVAHDPIWMKCCLLIGIIDIIICANFGDDRLRSVVVAGLSNFAILRIHSSFSLQTLHHYRDECWWVVRCVKYAIPTIHAAEWRHQLWRRV